MLILSSTSDFVLEKAFPPIEDDLSEVEVHGECPLTRTALSAYSNTSTEDRGLHCFSCCS